MIVDFQHHFTPRELFKEDLGDRRILQYDETGAPSYTSHALLYDLDEHIRLGLAAGLDDRWTLCRCIRHPALVFDRRDFLYADGTLRLSLFRSHGDGK